MLLFLLQLMLIPTPTSHHSKKKKNDHAVSLSSSNLKPQASDVSQSQSLAANSDVIFQSFADRIDELEIKLQWLQGEDVVIMVELWKSVKAAEIQFREIE